MLPSVREDKPLCGGQRLDVNPSLSQSFKYPVARDESHTVQLHCTRRIVLLGHGSICKSTSDSGKRALLVADSVAVLVAVVAVVCLVTWLKQLLVYLRQLLELTPFPLKVVLL